jgi:hypothetical protein
LLFSRRLPILPVVLSAPDQPNPCGIPSKGEAGTPASSSSVHPLETTVAASPGLTLQPPHGGQLGYGSTPVALRLEQTARHQSWAWRRWKVWQSMERTWQTAARRDRFAGCGAQLTLAKRGDELCLLSYCCHDRLCEVCQEQRRQQMRERLQILCMDGGDNVRFFTFTLRHSPTPLRDQIRRLRHCLRLLHQRPWWREHERAGYDCIEAKPAKHGTGWHVHAHCLVLGSYIDQKELARVWHSITGDSTIVDVERKGTPESMARYATKYATKALHEDVYTNPDLLDEAICALKGQRLTQAWGAWIGLEKDPDEPTLRAESIGTIADLVSASLAGDPGARLWLQLACVRWPSLERAVPTAAVAALPPPDPLAAPPDTPPPRDPRWNDTSDLLPF